MAAELGIPGLLLFLIWVGTAMAAPLKAIGRPPTRLRRYGEPRLARAMAGGWTRGCSAHRLGVLLFSARASPDTRF